ncbi:MAG: hypothetical protein WKF97_23565 [Chitinophagaceae bacterium]
MYNKKPGIDIINDLLEECILAYPLSPFIISIYKQYLQRGSLSKKQLQGLYGKALKIKDISEGKLATLEAVIKKMPTRYKSSLPAPTPLFAKEEGTGVIIASILEKYPGHKMVLFLKAKYDNNEALSSQEMADLLRFKKFLNR